MGIVSPLNIASCFCGAVQYALTAAPMFIHACHCRDCQVQTGGAFAINGIIEAEHIRLTRGKPVRVTMPTESGRPHDIYRCAKCQTALWSDFVDLPRYALGGGAR